MNWIFAKDKGQTKSMLSMGWICGSGQEQGRETGSQLMQGSQRKPWQGRTRGRGLAAAWSGLGRGGGCLCFSSGHWGLSGLPCPSQSFLLFANQSLAGSIAQQKVGCYLCSSDKAVCKPAAERLKGKPRTGREAGRVRVQMGGCYGQPVIAQAFVFQRNKYFSSWCSLWVLGAWS